MREIVAWLRDIEHMANQSYVMAADLFADDPRTKAFLEQLAEEENWHFRVMTEAAAYFAPNPAIPPAISVDEETRLRITKFFSRLDELVACRELSNVDLIKLIMEAELSEWNSIFLYVVNSIKDKSSQFTHAAASIQIHLKRIISFLESISDHRCALTELRAVPPVWTEKILVVDDDESITELLESLLYQEGRIDVAHNGREAMELIRHNFYKLIITDINMPVMNGVDLFRQSLALYPSLKKRFLFLSGFLSEEQKDFLQANHVRYLCKPVGIKTLREEAKKIILSD